MNLRRMIGLMILLFWVPINSIGAEPLQAPHVFSPGAKAKASEVNENFNLLYQNVNQVLPLKRFVIRDGGNIIGTLVSAEDSGFTFMTLEGYITKIQLDFYTGSFKTTPNKIDFLYESSDCTGQSYTDHFPSKIVTDRSADTLYYIDSNEIPVLKLLKSYKSKDPANPNCSTITDMNVFVFPITTNSSIKTGVPTDGYTGPITVGIE